MIEPIKTEEIKGYKLEIERERNAEDPRFENDNVAVFATKDMGCRYKLGDDINPVAECKMLYAKYVDEDCSDVSISEMMQTLNNLNDDLVIRQCSVYEHGGITMFYGEPTDRWDSCCVGFAYVEKTKLIEECYDLFEKDWHDIANKILDDEMAYYDAYLRGNIYKYTIYDSDGELADIVGGYIDEDEVYNHAVLAIYNFAERDEQKKIDAYELIKQNAKKYVGIQILWYGKAYRITADCFNQPVAQVAVVKNNIIRCYEDCNLSDFPSKVLTKIIKENG